MKITHIFHSGFMVEMEESVLLFDWYTGDLPQIPAGKRLYVFCSHAHEDHYSAMIWRLVKEHPGVVYVLDAGIADARRHPEADVFIVEPLHTYDIHGVKVCTLDSTDMGVAFYVETEGKRIYHAGDLNVWFWYDEPMEDNIASEKKCRAQMQLLADHLRTGEQRRTEEGRKPLLDVAFVPLDPRLLEEAPRCMAAFVDILDAESIFPMHYWEREAETRMYLDDARIRPFRERIHFDSVLEVR